MGQWTIVIEGTGCHHGQSEADAERLAKQFVDLLTTRGHTVSHASFTNSSRESMLGERRPDVKLTG